MTTCTDLSRRLGVDPAGTASQIRSWLLLEAPGPWGEGARDDAFADSLGAAGERLLRHLRATEQLTPLIIRRPGRAGRASDGAPVLLLGSTAGGRGWLERLPARALPDVDLEALAAGRPGHGEPVDGPVFAVCTNGSVDRCCAVLGRPLVAALADAHPEHTWEVSHVGGCEFGANLLVLPQAALHGRLAPEDGLRVAAAAFDGRTDTAQLRGLCGRSCFAGAAEVELRRRLALPAYDDVAVVAEDPHDDVLDAGHGPEPAGADVVLRAGGSLWRAVARTRELGTFTSVCDGTAPVTTTVVSALHPASSRRGGGHVRRWVRHTRPAVALDALTRCVAARVGTPSAGSEAG